MFDGIVHFTPSGTASPMRDLVLYLVISTFALSVAIAVIGIAFKLLQVRRKGLTSLLAIMAAFFILPVGWVGPAVAAVPLALGFAAGRSTRVKRDPTDTFSDEVKLSSAQFALYAHRFIHDPNWARPLESASRDPTVSVTGMLAMGVSVWMELRRFRALFRSPFSAPIVALGFLPFWATANISSTWLSLEAALLALLAFPFGVQMGILITLVSAHRSHQTAV